MLSVLRRQFCCSLFIEIVAVKVCGSFVFGEVLVSFLVMHCSRYWMLYFVFLLSCGCKCSESLPHDAVIWSAVNDYGISFPGHTHLHTVKHVLSGRSKIS